MKYFLTCLLFIISTLGSGLFAQKKVELSIGSLYSNFAGLSLELSAKKELNEKFGLMARSSVNFNKAYALRAGMFYNIIDRSKFDIDLGLEYVFELRKEDEINIQFNTHKLEIPFILGYRFSGKYSIYGGYSSSINIINSETFRFIDNIRIGLKYTL